MAKRILIVAIVAAMFVPSLAQAEDWAQGFGKSPTEAIESALKTAEKIVQSRGKGCVGPGKSGGKAVRYVGEKDGMYEFEAVYSHHDGSCGKQKTVAEYRKELGF